MITRRQHYVWRKYLEPWTFAQDGSRRIWCLRRGKSAPIVVDTTKVAVERDFYRLKEWDANDAEFVRALAFRNEVLPTEREVIEGHIARFESLFAQCRSTHERRHGAAYDQLLIEHQENAYQCIERDFLPMLAALQAGATSFLCEGTHGPRFFYYLAHQYFRTKTMRDRVRATLETTEQQARFDRIWPVLRYVLAANGGLGMYARHCEVPLRVIEAARGMEFITGAQPVVNAQGIRSKQVAAPGEFGLLYALSPTRVAILSDRSVYGPHGTALQPSQMGYLNVAIERAAHEQLFSRSEYILLAFAPTFCA